MLDASINESMESSRELVAENEPELPRGMRFTRQRLLAALYDEV
jgi:hypothetical protein